MEAIGTLEVEKDSIYTNPAAGPSSLEVRPLRVQDIPEVGVLVHRIVTTTEVWSEEFEYPMVAEVLAEVAAAGADYYRQVYVAFLDGEVVGAMGMEARPYYYSRQRAALDTGLWVEKKWRKLGVANALLQVFVAWGKAMGCKEAILANSTGKADMKAAKGAYRAAGFDIIGVVAKRKL